VTVIRPLEREDLPAVAALYAEFVGWDVAETTPGLVDFFARTLLDHQYADPEIPAIVYEDRRDGVVGLMGSHPRPFVYGDRSVRVACSGPLLVAPAHRPRGVGALLLRKYLAGPQDMTANDRVIDQVHAMWERLGGVTDSAASIGWACVLAPVGFATGAVVRRVGGPDRPPGRALLSKLDAPARRRLCPEPGSGTVEPLANDALIDLLSGLERQFPLRPAYDEAFLAWLFGEMELVNVGDRLVRRLVRDDDGRPLGAYVMYVSERRTAELVQLAAAGDDVGLVLDHLMHDAAAQGAVEVRGRFEPHLVPHLRGRRVRLTYADWTIVQARDPELVGAVLAGRALLSRLDGEWWMRPRRTEMS
jgi:predicted N-acetyltransferase YhbS